MSVLETYFVTLLVIAIAYKVESNNFKYQQFLKVPNPDQRYLIDKVEMLCEKKINF